MLIDHKIKCLKLSNKYRTIIKLYSVWPFNEDGINDKINTLYAIQSSVNLFVLSKVKLCNLSMDSYFDTTPPPPRDYAGLNGVTIVRLTGNSIKNIPKGGL